MSRSGKRGPHTALISYNAPSVERERLRAIAREMFPGEKNSFSLLMRKIHREFIRASSATKSSGGEAPRREIIQLQRREAR